MNDYNELKRLAEAVEACTSMEVSDEAAWMSRTTGEKVLELLEEIDHLKAENDQLKGKIDFYSQSVKLLDGALASAEKTTLQKSQRVSGLEDRIELIRITLGRFSYIVDYPDEESSSVFDDLRKDAERYRAMFSDTYCGRPAFDFSEEWIGEAKEKVDRMIDAAMIKEPKSE